MYLYIYINSININYNNQYPPSPYINPEAKYGIPGFSKSKSVYKDFNINSATNIPIAPIVPTVPAPAPAPASPNTGGSDTSTDINKASNSPSMSPTSPEPTTISILKAPVSNPLSNFRASGSSSGNSVGSVTGSNEDEIPPQDFFSNYLEKELKLCNNDIEKNLLLDLYKSFKPLEDLIKSSLPTPKQLIRIREHNKYQEELYKLNLIKKKEQKDKSKEIIKNLKEGKIKESSYESDSSEDEY